MTRSVIALALLAAACAPQSPEQRADAQRDLQARMTCERQATQASGVQPWDYNDFDDDDDGFFTLRPSRMAARAMFRSAYYDCLAAQANAARRY